jgi:hypothetical protein
MNEPIDLWWLAKNSGVTSEGKGSQSFKKESPDLPANSSLRHQNGTRIDYFWSWRGTRFWPTFANTSVLVWQFGTGSDISDHYGLQTIQENLRMLTVHLV